jgi:hypothetical protein
LRRPLEAIKSFLVSQAFDHATHRAGAYLLLLSNLVLPLGLHRLWMRLPGCWWFPLTFVLGAVGAWNHLGSNHAAAWKVLALPFPLLLAMDFWALATTPVPRRIKK